MSEFIKLLMDLIDDKTMVIMAVTVICLVVIFRGEVSAEVSEIIKIGFAGLFGVAVGYAVAGGKQ